MTPPTPFEKEMREKSLEYSGHEPKEPLNGLNLIALDQRQGFIRGARWALTSELVRELEECLKIGIDAAYNSTTSSHAVRRMNDALAAYRKEVGGG